MKNETFSLFSSAIKSSAIHLCYFHVLPTVVYRKYSHFNVLYSIFLLNVERLVNDLVKALHFETQDA